MFVTYDGPIVLRSHKFKLLKASDYGYTDDDYDGHYYYYLDGYVGSAGISNAQVERGLEFDSVQMVFRYTKPQPLEHIKFDRAVKALISYTGDPYFYGGDETNLSELRFFAQAFRLKGLCRFALSKYHRAITSNYLQVLLQHLHTSAVSAWFVRPKLDRSEPFTLEEYSRLFNDVDFLHLVCNGSLWAYHSWHRSDSYMCNNVAAEGQQYPNLLQTLQEQTRKCLDLWLEILLYHEMDCPWRFVSLR